MAALTREAEENVRDGDLRYLVSHRSVPPDLPPLFSLQIARVLFRAESHVVLRAGYPGRTVLWEARALVVNRI